MLIHWFLCSACGDRRKWGFTIGRTEDVEVKNPLLTCVRCSPAVHIPFRFDGYQTVMLTDHDPAADQLWKSWK